MPREIDSDLYHRKGNFHFNVKSRTVYWISMCWHATSRRNAAHPTSTVWIVEAERRQLCNGTWKATP